MAQANDQQMQAYADERLRHRAELVRSLVILMTDDRAAINDIYDRAVNGAPWDDARTDGPPTLLSQDDLLAYNSFAADMITAITGHGSYAVVLSACVRAPEIS